MNEIWHMDALDAPNGLAELQPINCIVADPPYGVNFVSRRAELPAGKKFVAEIANDADLDGAVELFHDVMNVLMPHTADECDIYVFTRWDIVDTWMKAVREIGHDVNYKMLLVWDKGIPGMGDIDANWGCGHELILYCKKGRRDVSHRRSGIIHVDKLGSKQHIHPTEKPVGLIRHLIEMSTARGDLVVDPFSGSGSTSVAALELGRNSVGIEKDERYIEPSRSRLQQQMLF